MAKQLTASPSDKQDWQFSPDSKEVVYLDAGQLRRLAGRSSGETDRGDGDL